MTELQYGIVKLLKENARYTNVDIANILGVKEREVETAIKDMEKSGFIVKYATIFNEETVKDGKVQALIEVKVALQKLKSFNEYAEELYNFDEVKSMYLMSGGFDLAVFVEGKDITEIAEFISEKLSVIDGITSVQTHFILKKYKIEGQITKPSKDGERQLIQA
ncbi:MAG: Lrp/AsnC family transcriptional regulator [Clostridia bacterium]|nr:Lrp/AsnC family transcriptional regulator [Clostridia bacterium]